MLSSLTTFQESVKCKVWKKWQLFHATDFQSLMYPCFTFCSVLGLFPYKINGSTFETSKQRYILPTVVLCVLCSYELIVLYEIDITQTIKFKGVPKTLERNCFYILGNFIAVVTYILSGPRMHLLQSIMNVSSNLPLNSYQQLSKLIHTKDVIGFVFLIGEMVFYYSTLDFDTWHKAFVPYLNFLIFQTDMLYMNCVCILKACFKRIDDNLINLRDHVVNDQPHLLRRNYHVKRNPLLLMELKALKKQHLAISDTVEMLNVIFSLQIIASVILTFAEITFQLYFYIMHWKIGVLMNNLSHRAYNVLLVVFMTYYTIKIVLIVWACETGKDQAIKIGTTIHELLNDVTDEQIKSELQLFSLQILHRENAFTAKGLIVDATLLTAIVGNITTYLLILIQFLIAANSCHGKLTHNITEINF
ncbi:PREDICTED: putative gustatory receptor 28a isoform X1 [Wasmannia auropunctata]|uniref:putative gustatory receptor 28a isoform X1 n=1 Tax=Wasmannia auropunctata TaxID=64793 RepID=UPI0005EDF426|nr:PREDICTED: putative gustatory receptor 28a isoform X1 [Wasmannia auropunctata]